MMMNEGVGVSRYGSTLLEAWFQLKRPRGRFNLEYTGRMYDSNLRSVLEILSGPYLIREDVEE
jgi:hypothetical protein